MEPVYHANTPANEVNNHSIKTELQRVENSNENQQTYEQNQHSELKVEQTQHSEPTTKVEQNQHSNEQSNRQSSDPTPQSNMSTSHHDNNGQNSSSSGEQNGYANSNSNSYSQQSSYQPGMPPALMQQPQSDNQYNQSQNQSNNQGAAADADGDIASLPLKTGTVRWFNATKGYGFVGPNDGGPDAFVHQNQLRCDGYRSLEKEQVVEYRLKIGPDGKNIALAVTAPGGGVLPPARNPNTPTSSHSAAPVNQYAPAKSYPPTSSYGAPSSHQTPGQQVVPAGAPYDGKNSRPSHLTYIRGTVKSWDSGKGYGFLKGSDVSDGSQVSSSDLFVHQNNVHAEHANRQLVPGMRVEYTHGIDEKNGKPLAQYVTGPNGSLITRQDIDRAAGVIGYGQPSIAPRGVTLTGHIDRFDPAKKYGFIKPDVGSTHIFMHASRISLPMDEVRPGMRVSFQMGLDHQGKDAAVDVVPLDVPHSAQSSGGYARGRSPVRNQPGHYSQPQRGMSPARGSYDQYSSEPRRDRERLRSPPRDYYSDSYRQPVSSQQPPMTSQVQYNAPPMPHHDQRNMYQPPPSYGQHHAPPPQQPHDPYYSSHMQPPPPMQPPAHQYGGYQPPPPVHQQPMYNTYHAPPPAQPPMPTYAPQMPPPNQYAPQGPPPMHYQQPPPVMPHQQQQPHMQQQSHMQPPPMQQQPPMQPQAYSQQPPPAMSYSSAPPQSNDAQPAEIVNKLFSLYQTLTTSKP